MKQESKKKQTISPVTWIILVLAIVGFIYIYFTPQPNAGGNQSTSALVNEVDTPVQPGVTESEGNQEINVISEIKTEDGTANSARNPFLPPLIVRNYLEKQSKLSSPVSIIPTPSVPVNGGNANNVAGEKPEEKPVETKPVWKGYLGTQHDRLAIVRYKGKAYFLRVGDRLKESDYVLTQMGSNYIVLDSPKEQLKLVKEKTGGRKQ